MQLQLCAVFVLRAQQRQLLQPKPPPAICMSICPHMGALFARVGAFIATNSHRPTLTHTETGTLTWAWAQANAKTPKDSSIDSSKSTSRLRCHRGHTHVVWHPHLFGIFDIDVDDVDCRWRCRCRCRMAATACTLNVIDGSACAALRGPS